MQLNKREPGFREECSELEVKVWLSEVEQEELEIYKLLELEQWELEQNFL